MIIKKNSLETYIEQLKNTINANKGNCNKNITRVTIYKAEDYHQDFYKKNPERYAEERKKYAKNTKRNNIYT